ncbi:oleosin H1-like [Nicotiana tabacum]|uniref:Oleosin n=3 Tax=Nicotiana TaxID=4085 RepID=A0A1S3Y4B6_TOBAC|nr:PREDICTED: oleosin 5-like [Nicotiana sylvestris]XP_016447000.1 PREDICTED: oleosin 5-like [Nicotiana tabacum]XP_019250020.1 PREDICTED: oleosin 5-like [Nicotiana attenuata]
MADVRHPHQIQVHPQHPRYEGGVKTLLPQRGPSATQVLAIVTLLPVGATLLGIAGLTLLGTIIGLCVATPVFLLFSPVLVPAALTVALAVTGFLTSGAFGLTGLSSLSWIVNYFKQGRTVTEQLDYTKRRMQERMADAAAQVGQKTKDVGQAIQSKAQEGKEGGRT